MRVSRSRLENTHIQLTQKEIRAQEPSGILLLLKPSPNAAQLGRPGGVDTPPNHRYTVDAGG
jgi:hypothetical protein